MGGRHLRSSTGLRDNLPRKPGQITASKILGAVHPDVAAAAVHEIDELLSAAPPLSVLAPPDVPRLQSSYIRPSRVGTLARSTLAWEHFARGISLSSC